MSSSIESSAPSGMRPLKLSRSPRSAQTSLSDSMSQRMRVMCGTLLISHLQQQLDEPDLAVSPD